MAHTLRSDRNLRLGLVLLALAAPLSGCGRDAEEEFAEAVVASSLQSERNEKAGGVIVDSVRNECVNDPALAAAAVAERPPVGIYPPDCVSKSAEGSNLHVEYAGCTGPFGRVTLAGGVDATFAVTGECQLHVGVEDSGNLTANGRELDYQATADVDLLPDQRDVEWHASFETTNDRDAAVRQSSDLDVVIDLGTDCHDIVGALRGQVGDRRYRATIEDLVLCSEGCPASGRVEAQVEGARRDRTLTVRFDGSNRAQVTGWSGREFEVDLVCADDE
jgi:hypothetical protein